MSVKPEEAAFQALFVNKKWTCRFCGKTHSKEATNCPAFGKVCVTFKKKSHFSSTCWSSGAVNLPQDEGNKTKQDSHSEDEVMALNEAKFKNRLFVKLCVDKNWKRKRVALYWKTHENN